MMLGAIAAARRRLVSGGGGAGDPLATIDFISDVYDVDGVTLAAADVVDKPGRIGAGGLEILDNDVDGVVSAIGDLLTLLLTVNWTVVIEWEEYLSGGTYLLYVQEFVGGHSLTIVRGNTFQSHRMMAEDDGFITRDDAIVLGPFDNGVHKVAVTRTNDFISMSVDGSTVATDGADNTTMNTLTSAAFGGDPTDQSYNGCFIRSLTVYAPVTDDVLRALSS